MIQQVASFRKKLYGLKYGMLFLNEQILQDGVSRDFYRMKSCESWGDLETKLLAILTDSAIPARLAAKQKQEFTEKVKKLRDQLDEQNLLINVLIGMVNRLRDTREKERETAQFQLQENLTTLHRVEGERNGLKNVLLSMFNNQFPKQEGTEEEENRNETQTLGDPVFVEETENYWARKEMVEVSGQDAAAASVEEEAKEEKVISVNEKAEEVDDVSYSEIRGAWAKGNPLPPLTLTQSPCPLLPLFHSPEAEEETIVPSVSYSGSRWKGKQLHNRKFVPRKYTAECGFSHSARCGFKRRQGDWDCGQCGVMNFSWRSACFKCKNFRCADEIVDSLHNDLNEY
jgi:hypothetical protein